MSMRIYGSSMSPFVRKVLVFCAEKGVQVESVPIGLRSDDDEFRGASPLGKMPALIDGDYCLADSSAILHYVEARYPEPQLIPADPQSRGRAIWFEEYADTILSGCGAKMFFNRVVAPVFLKREGDLAAADRAEREELPPILAYLEVAIGEQEFLLGHFTVADIAIGTSLPNLEHCGHQLDASAYPRLAAYQERFFSRPSVDALLRRERAYFARMRE